MQEGRLGIIAGAGGLPAALARACEESGREIFVARLEGMADAEMAAFAGVDVGIGEFGKIIAALRGAGCDSLCFVGRVFRPNFSTMKVDLRAASSLPGVIAAATRGDDALMRRVLQEFEKEGFRIVGPEEVMRDLAIGVGPLGAVAPETRHQSDIVRALEVARELGRQDIGQGAVVCDGAVLALEAQEGTDAMLARCAGLPLELHGGPGDRRGVLAKAPKPIQDRRIDLPTIGVRTLEGARAAGLAGVVGEAGGLLVVDREAVIAAADRLGLFILGVAAPEP